MADQIVLIAVQDGVRRQVTPPPSFAGIKIKMGAGFTAVYATTLEEAQSFRNRIFNTLRDNTFANNKGPLRDAVVRIEEQLDAQCELAKGKVE